MVHRDVKLKKAIGAPQATKLVKTAGAYGSVISLQVGHKKVNVKSMMGVISLGVVVGDVLTLSASGNDEREAIKAVVDLFEGGL